MKTSLAFILGVVAVMSAGLARGDGTAPTRGNPVQSIPLATLDATRDRPLFSISRRPPESAVVDAPAPPAPTVVLAENPEEQRPPFSLIGTIIGADRRFAVLQNQATQAVSSVAEGDARDGWRVRSVSARATVLERDAKIVTLDLPRPDSAPSMALDVAENRPPVLRRRTR